MSSTEGDGAGEAVDVVPCSAAQCAMPAALRGVFPVLATPFNADLAPDERGLRAIARYAIEAGADGIVYPGVASEYDTLTMDECAGLVDIVAAVARDRVPLIVGASAPDIATTETAMRQA